MLGQHEDMSSNPSAHGKGMGGCALCADNPNTGKKSPLAGQLSESAASGSGQRASSSRSFLRWRSHACGWAHTPAGGGGLSCGIVSAIEHNLATQFSFFVIGKMRMGKGKGKTMEVERKW